MKKLFFIFLFMFNFVLLAACSKTETTSTNDTYKLTVVAPQGAPAVALANVAINDKDQYSFINAELIGEQFAANQKDIIVAPVNAGAAQFKNGKSTYKLGAILTWGNIYVATQRADINELSDLNGKTITLFGKTSTNYPIAKYALEQSGVTATYTDGNKTAAQTKDLLVDDENAIVVTAEPALTVATNQLKSQGKTVKTFSIQELYKNVTGSDYTQAALFIKASAIAEHKSVVDKYLDDVKASCDLFTSDLDKAASNVLELAIPGVPAAKPVLLTALPKCSIKYVSALDAKADLEKTANIDLTKFGGAVPANEFYYSE